MTPILTLSSFSSKLEVPVNQPACANEGSTKASGKDSNRASQRSSSSGTEDSNDAEGVVLDTASTSPPKADDESDCEASSKRSLTAQSLNHFTSRLETLSSAAHADETVTPEEESERPQKPKRPIVQKQARFEVPKQNPVEPEAPVSDSPISPVQVSREWATDRQTNRGTYGKKKGSISDGRVRARLMLLNAFHGSEQSIRNAVRIGIILKTLHRILVAIAVQKKWLQMPIEEPNGEFADLVQAVRRKIQLQYQRSSTGHFDRSTFCRLIRVVGWIYREILDDLHGSQCSRGATDQLHGKVFRAHFRQDYARVPSSVFSPFAFPEEKERSLLRDPTVVMLSSTVVLSPSDASSRSQKRFKKDKMVASPSAEPDGIEQMATALTDFWFGRLRMNTSIQEFRDKHSVRRDQPVPYEQPALCRMSTQQRACLKARCLATHAAMNENIGLFIGETKVTESEAGLAYLDNVRFLLEKDGRDIEQMFAGEDPCRKDADILLWYSSLRSHVWSAGWYGVRAESLKMEDKRHPGKVESRAMSIEFKKPK